MILGICLIYLAIGLIAAGLFADEDDEAIDDFVIVAIWPLPVTVFICAILYYWGKSIAKGIKRENK